MTDLTYKVFNDILKKLKDMGDGTYAEVVSTSSATADEIGILTETAPTTDTASSGLNGRLQRIAQRLTSLIALLPSALSNGFFKVSIQEQLLGGHGATVTITRPNDTTAYAAKDAIGDVGGSAILTFANMARAAGDVMLTSLTLELDLASSTIGATTLYLYNASPAAIADNAAWDFVSGDRGKYLGKINIPAPTDEGSTMMVEVDQINKQFTLASTSIYGILTADTAYTPTASAVKRITLHTLEL